MTGISTIQRVSTRLVRLRRTVRIDTQRMRENALESLEDLFILAANIAKGEVKTVNVRGKKVAISLKQRQIWARVAAYIAQIMNSIAEGFDEKTIDTSLADLERMVDEAKAKAEAGKAEESPRGAASPGH
jgi:hypothetical protein